MVFFLVVTSLHVQTERENLLVCVSWSSLLYMYTDWKGKFVSLWFFSWSSLLYMYRLKGKICQSVFLGCHFFTCTLIEREIVFVILEIVFVIPYLLVIPSLHVHWLKRRLFVIPCLSVITSFFLYMYIDWKGEWFRHSASLSSLLYKCSDRKEKYLSYSSSETSQLHNYRHILIEKKSHNMLLCHHFAWVLMEMENVCVSRSTVHHFFAHCVILF